MKATHAAWTLVAAFIVIAAPLGVGTPVAAQHAAAQHVGQSSSTLPGAVRQATERFLDVNDAIAAGWSVLNGGCVSGPEEGAMGVHYVNPALFDDKLEVDQPEALVYEPKRGGRLQLVAIEYITPAPAWHGTHPADVLPLLMGHLFHFAAGPNRYGPLAFYELHVWAWKENPRGTFADWNPNVSCAAWEG
jgi:hypothetical protein